MCSPSRCCARRPTPLSLYYLVLLTIEALSTRRSRFSLLISIFTAPIILQKVLIMFLQPRDLSVGQQTRSSLLTRIVLSERPNFIDLLFYLLFLNVFNEVFKSLLKINYFTISMVIKTSLANIVTTTYINVMFSLESR